MTSTVFVFAPKDGRFNLSSAEDYGQVVHVDLGYGIFQTDQLNQAMKATAKALDPDRDFIAITGNSLTVALAVSAAMAEYGKVRLLIFDARTSSYVERTVRA